MNYSALIESDILVASGQQVTTNSTSPCMPNCATGVEQLTQIDWSRQFRWLDLGRTCAGSYKPLMQHHGGVADQCRPEEAAHKAELQIMQLGHNMSYMPMCLHARALSMQLH